MFNLSGKQFVCYNRHFLTGLFPVENYKINPNLSEAALMYNTFNLRPREYYKIHLKAGSIEYIGEGQENMYTSFRIGPFYYTFIPLTNWNSLFVKWDLTDGFCVAFKSHLTMGINFPSGYPRKNTIISYKILPLIKPLAKGFR